MPPTELLAPGGSLNQAVHALRAGADAVYCGAPRFSARSHAKNLDYPELRRLCGAARTRPAAEGGAAAVYLALNTLLRDEELPLALESAWRAWEAGVQAIIIQDLGLLRALRRHGPPLGLHASTQMAIHDADGARQAQDWGLSRVVLARELSLEEIAAIHAACPGLELEVFIHGALCYGASGLCLASGLLLGRSGNRGDCAQVCRSWSQAQPGGPGHWFSMNDLEAGDAVRSLRAAGAHSFKIEGRMKPPEWTAAVVRHYRALLDGTPAPGLDAARTVFGRLPSAGFLHDRRGQGLVNPVQAGSVGLAVGRIQELKQGRALVRLAVPLAVKDGIQVVRAAKADQPAAVFRAAVRGLQAEGQGQAAWQLPAGTLCWITVDRSQAFLPSDRGLELSKVADHASNLPEIKPESLPLHHHGLAFSATLAGTGMMLSATLPFCQDGVPVTRVLELPVQPGSGDGGAFALALERQLAQSGDSAFGLGSLSCAPELAACFVPPSALKAFRRAWYEELDRALAEARAAALAEQARDAAAAPGLPGPALPPRSQLSPRGELPFVLDFSRLEPADLALWRGWRVLPLSPLWFSDPPGQADQGSSPRQACRDWLARHAGQGPFLLGLNNPAQLAWLAGLDLPWFADYLLYAANGEAPRLLAETLPGLIAASPWIEDPSQARDPDLRVPLFISRACFHRESLGRGCPGGGPAGCPRRFEYQLAQGPRRYRVLVRDCLSFTFAADGASAGPRSAGPLAAAPE